MLLMLAKLLVRCFYRVTAKGLENLPPKGFLLLPNHVTWVDAVVLQVACPRMIRFMVFEDIYLQPALHGFFRMIGAIPISQRRSKEAIRHAIELIEKGEIVCIFPEGELSRTGILLRIKRGYELIARGANAPVVPVWLDQLWGSIFSYYGGKFFTKIPKKIPYPVLVSFGKPMAPEEADIATVRQKMLELGEECYEERPILKTHLAEACIRGLKHKQFDTVTLRDAPRRDSSAAKAALHQALPVRLAERWLDLHLPQRWTNLELEVLDRQLHRWEVRPSGTEGYEKAEVTAGGVNTDELSARTMECRKVPGLYFIGEVVDVTGQLGGFNFQWAWASGYCAGQAV